MTKEEIKLIEPQTWENLGLLERAKKSGYICPNCGNGSGEDGTGVDFDNNRGDGFGGYCHKCNTNFDIFNIIQRKFSLENFKEQIAKIEEILTGKEVKIAQKITPKTEEKFDYTNYILSMRKDLESFVGENYRGISYATLKKFYCGYDGDKQRFIIPYDWTHYLERYVGDGNCEKPKKHSKGGKTVFGLGLAKKHEKVFITEGEFDALSFWEIGYPAISFGGSTVTKEQQNLLENFSKNTQFFICLDNDDVGKKAAKKYLEIFNNLGFRAGIFIQEIYKDPNEFLQENRAEFQTFADRIFAENVPEITQKLTEISTDTEITTAQKFINAPIDLTVPHGFICEPNAIKFIVEKKPPVTVTNTPILITKIFRTNDFDRSQIEIQIQDPKSKKWHAHTIERRLIAETKNITTLADFGLSITSKKAGLLSDFLTNLLATNVQKIPECIIKKCVGWNEKNDEFFYPNSGGNNLLDSYYNYNEKFCAKGEKSEWLKIFVSPFDFHMAVRLAVGTALSAPLIKLLNVPNVQLALIASTGKGKSAVCNLAMSIFGDPIKLMNTFNSTANYADNLARYYKDLPCWIDEFQSANKNMRESVENTVYNFAGGETKGRSNRNGENRAVVHFNGSRLYTAEQSILKNATNAGALMRLLEIDATKIIDDKTARKIHEFTKSNFGHFGLDWCKYIFKYREDIKATQEQFFKELMNTWPEHASRHLQSLSVIEAAVFHFCKMTGIRADDEIEYNRNRDREELLGEILPTMKQASNADRALRDLSESLITHESYFKREKDNHEVWAAKFEPALGIIFKNGDVGFFPRPIKNFLEKDCGYSDAKSVFKQLAEDNKLIHDNDPKRPYQKTMRLENKICRLYLVERSALEE